MVDDSGWLVRRCRRDDAQASILLIAVFGLMTLVLVVTQVVASRAIERGVAQSAADAAALAAVLAPEPTAIALAHVDGADSAEVLYDPDTAIADATVTVGSMTARARAQGLGEGLAVSPAVVAVNARVEQLVGRPVGIEPVIPDPYAVLVGDPTLTFDVDPTSVDDMVASGAELGVCRPDPTAEPLRFRLC